MNQVVNNIIENNTTVEQNISIASPTSLKVGNIVTVGSTNNTVNDVTIKILNIKEKQNAK